MKNLLFLLTITFSALSCEKELLIPAAQTTQANHFKSEEIEFVTWSENVKPEYIEAMYLSCPNVMCDVRNEFVETHPFSYEDIILRENADGPNTYYPHTRNVGFSIVRFQDSIVFQNTWNNSYMSQDKTMTIIEYGKISNFKLMRVTNESYFPPCPGHPNGYFARENKLYIYNSYNLLSINPQNIGIPYYFGAIKQAPIEGVVILYGGGFPRSYPQYKYFVLYDLASNLYKIFKLPA